MTENYRLVEVPNMGKVEFPASMSDDEVANVIKTKIMPSQTTAQPPTQDVNFSDRLKSAAMRVGQGIIDPVTAGAQMLTNALPGGVVKAGNQFNNYLADKTGLVDRLPEGGLNQQIKEDEIRYQQQRKAAGSEGIDFARMGGNIISPANLAIALKMPQALTTGARIATGVGAGILSGGITSPVTSGDYAKEKEKQMLMGGAFGGAIPAVAAAVSPKVNPQVQMLMNEGVTPTPGQILGGTFQKIEDKLTSMPLLGDAIAYARRKGLDEFNVAALTRALKSIGSKTESMGREGIADVRGKLSDAYNNLLPNLTFKSDATFASGLNNLKQLASQLPESEYKQFNKIIADQLENKMTSSGLMNGETLKVVESELSRQAKGYLGEQSFDKRQLGSALEEALNLVRQNLQRTNPPLAKELGKINEGYAQYARLRDAAGRQGSLEGKFTPDQLAAAVRAQDKTLGKRAYSEGTALMQDLTDAGKSVLSPKYPDSGTAGRAALNIGGAGAAGAGYISPELLAAGGAASLPYLPYGRQAAAALLTKRPSGAGAMAEALRKFGPYSVPTTSQFNQPLRIEIIGNGGQQP